VNPAILSFLFASVCAIATASIDVPVRWSAVTVEFGSGEAAGRVRIGTRDRAISELTLRWVGKDLTVPASEFARIPDPHLDTLQVQVGQFYGGIHDNAQYLVVELHSGQPSEGAHPRARFLFFSGAYRELRIEKPDSPK
jgi:hypothetical protein